MTAGNSPRVDMFDVIESDLTSFNFAYRCHVQWSGKSRNWQRCVRNSQRRLGGSFIFQDDSYTWEFFPMVFDV